MFSKYLGEIVREFNQILRSSNVPVVTASFTGKEDSSVELMMELGIPVYSTPERASAALAAMAKYARYRGILK